MFLCLKKVTRPKTSCEKQVVIQLKPNLALVFLSPVPHRPPVLCQKYLERGEERCMYCATEGGVMHTVPHTAGLTRKPHYCKLPHFTLSKGATTTKKKKRTKKETTHMTSGKTFLMVRLSSQHALTTHYIPYMFYEMLLQSHSSFFF